MRKPVLVGIAMALLALAPGHAPSSASVPGDVGHRSAGPLDVYFRTDAVGRNMVRLAATACGTERWPVKTLTDDDRDEVNLAAREVSIRYLRRRATPVVKPQSSRAGTVERTTYRVHARLHEYVREADGDYHLVLRDRRGRTIVAEIPDGTCVGRISPVKSGVVQARSRFDRQLDATRSFKSANRRVVIKGIGFFDFFHGQTGMAPNDLELHPVIGLRLPH